VAPRSAAVRRPNFDNADVETRDPGGERDHRFNYVLAPDVRGK